MLRSKFFRAPVPSRNSVFRFTFYFLILILSMSLAILNVKIGKTMTLKTNATNTMSNTTASTQDEIIEEIQALTREITPLESAVQPLKDNAVCWDKWYLRSVGIAAAVTALAILGTFGIQWKARKTQVTFESAQTRLVSLKDRRSQLALKAGDIRATKLEHDTEILRNKNLALEAIIAPRRLSNRQKDALAALTNFTGLTVEIKSYSSDTEGAILASEILAALRKPNIQIVDNRLTILPSGAGSVTFGVSIEGTNTELVAELKRILAMDGHLTETSSIPFPDRGGISFGVRTGLITSGTPPVAIVTVGPKPIKTE